jgi:hypothetical protein
VLAGNSTEELLGKIKTTLHSMVPSSVLFPDKLYIYIDFNCTSFTTLDVKVHPASASTWGALGQIAATDDMLHLM